MLERQTVDRNAPPQQLNDKPKDADDSADEDKVKSDNAGPAAVREDWWLVRDAQNRVGWVLGRTLYLSVPEEIAQYSEGQRIVASFPLDEVEDGGNKVPEYLVLFTEKEGLPYDFDQARVFTWNTRKHRYETAYRERELAGVLPVALGRQGFEKEGNLRTFKLHTKEDDGSERERTYKSNRPIVRRVLAPGEEPSTPKHHKTTKTRSRAQSKHQFIGIQGGQFIVQQGMAEKVKQLNLERDYKKYLYFVDGSGNVSRKSKSGEGETEVLVPQAIERDNQFLYFVDKEGYVARSPRAVRRTTK